MREPRRRVCRAGMCVLGRAARTDEVIPSGVVRGGAPNMPAGVAGGDVMDLKLSADRPPNCVGAEGFGAAS